MSDPYKVLGVGRGASDDEIKAAYRNLVKKYHPDRYNRDPAMAELAAEKMKDVNDAYDRILAERKNGVASGDSHFRYNSGASGYPDVRQLIKAGRMHDAEQILNGVPLTSRNAEWYFLKGSILYSRGWLEEAYTHFSRAMQMEPGNMEYRAAFNQVAAQRGGVHRGGYQTDPGMAQGCSGCEICSTLICADCCCECMGGDLIRCC